MTSRIGLQQAHRVQTFVALTWNSIKSAVAMSLVRESRVYNTLGGCRPTRGHDRRRHPLGRSSELGGIDEVRNAAGALADGLASIEDLVVHECGFGVRIDRAVVTFFARFRANLFGREVDWSFGPHSIDLFRSAMKLVNGIKERVSSVFR